MCEIIYIKKELKENQKIHYILIFLNMYNKLLR